MPLNQDTAQRIRDIEDRINITETFFSQLTPWYVEDLRFLLELCQLYRTNIKNLTEQLTNHHLA